MSFNRRNVVWQSKDGTWSRAFYEAFYINEDSDNFCPERDVDYYERFDWATTGHSTAEEAEQSWEGSNPGGHWFFARGDAQLDKTCDELDAMVIAFNEEQAKVKAERIEKALKGFFA